MTMIKKYSYILFLFILTNVNAQNNGQWLSIGLQGKFNKQFSFEVEQGFRFSDWLAISQNNYTEFGVNYKISKELKFSGAYRFTQRGSMFNSTRFENRFSVEGRYRVKLDDFRLNVRTRYLTRYRDVFTSENGKVPQRFFRLKAYLDYKINKQFWLSGGTELFWQLTNYYGRGFNNLWLFGGIDYDLNKQQKISLTYIWQSREFASDDVAFGSVISLSYVFNLDLSGSDD